jgi:hypothetical protein
MGLAVLGMSIARFRRDPAPAGRRRRRHGEADAATVGAGAR